MQNSERLIFHPHRCKLKARGRKLVSPSSEPYYDPFMCVAPLGRSADTLVAPEISPFLKPLKIMNFTGEDTIFYKGYL